MGAAAYSDRVAVAAALLLVGAYLAGTFPTALMVGRRSGFDPSVAGSGNPGASNAMRLGGSRAGALVLAGDLSKGLVAAGVGLAVGGRPLGFAMGGAAVLGHIAPLTRRFRGGKGVATAAGMAAALLPVEAAVAGGTFLLAALATRTASVASLAAVIAMVVAVVVAGRPAGEIAAVVATAALVAVRHRGNLARLRRAKERPMRGSASP